MLNKKTIAALLALAGYSSAAFDPCKFNFGESWEGPDASYAAQTDYVTIWVGHGGGQSNYNRYWEGDMLAKCKAGSGHAIAGKTPVLYSYIIAFLAKNKGGLQDCDVAGKDSPSSLCVSGGAYVKNKDNYALILQKYDEFSKGAASSYGTSSPIIWLLEPDFHQYAEKTSYWGTQTDTLSTAEAATLMTAIVAKIKANLPNAQISFDISPWIGGADWKSAQTTWWNAMPTSSFNYRNTSGGRTQGDQARIRKDANNLTTWAGIKEVSGLPIIADDGYGVGGASNSDWYEWMTAANTNARIADGVIALSIQKPASDYNDKIAAIRASLNKPASCGGGGGTTTPSKFTLTISPATTNGSIALSPAGGSYDSAKTVTATPTAVAGYTFGGWSGACTGTGACNITMNANKTLSATFTKSNVTMYTLMTSAGNGSIALSPAGGSYASGATVTATATPPSGYTFSGWSGACTGTGACSITMDANKTLTASWTQSQSTVTHLINTNNPTNGSIKTTPAGPNYTEGSSVTLTAVPKAGYTFKGWQGACSGMSTCTVTIPGYDLWIGADFIVSSGIGQRLSAGERLMMGQGVVVYDARELGASKLELVDLQGRATTLWQGQGNSFGEVSLRGVKAGLYFAHLRGQSGSYQKLIQVLH